MSGFLTRHPEFMNSDKQRVLNVVAQQLSQPGIANWFDDMHDSGTDKFLGKALAWGGQSGVHKVLFDQLKKVEPQLLGRGVTVAREHRTAHDPGIKSPHSWGLAIDIDYEDNPYIMGDSDAGPVANSNTGRALQNATLLLEGYSRGINASYLSGLSVMKTADIYDTLKDLDDTLIKYLALDGDLPRITMQLQGWVMAVGTAAAALQGQTPTVAASRWLGQIRQDKQNLVGTVGKVPTNFRQGSALTGLPRDPTKGFLTLSKDLVVTLRDQACLAWGAVDFGPTASGDFQHFDTRRLPGAGSVILMRSGSWMPPLC